jgi:hypothetical protein
MNNIPVEKVGASELSRLSLNALNSEMGATCPVVTRPYHPFLPSGTIIMNTYNGSISPAGTFYGTGEFCDINTKPIVTN